MAFQPRMIRGERAEPFPQADVVRETIFAISEITEKRIFTEAEILGLIEQIASEEGYKLKDLRVKQKGYDQNGNLVTLIVVVTPEKARSLGDGETEYGYVLKGRHGGNFSDTSVLYRTYNISDTDYCAGGIVGEYINDAWVIPPHAMSHKVTLEPLDES